MAEAAEFPHRLTPSGPTRVGVAGWSYPDWNGIVYPRAPRFDGLVYLAAFFDTLEVNSSFYRIPTRRSTESWARRVGGNPGFRFTLKLYKGFTHQRTAGGEEEKSFHEALGPLLERDLLGAVLLQFPWSFKNEAGSRTWLTGVLERFRDYPLVVEVRHASWNQPGFYAFLAERGVGFCNIDQPLFGRSIAPSGRTTSPVGYVRLHGRNYQDWFRESAGRDARYDYLYTEEELDPWLEKVNEIGAVASETYVITNNHFRGQAVVNALQIRSRVEGRRVEAPEGLLEHYPLLRRVADPPSDTQGELFRRK